MASAWTPVPTPPPATDRQPTQGEILFFRSHPHLGANFRIVAEAYLRYNCFPWSLGFTDRWIDGGTPEQMRRLYAFYFYVPAQSANDAEIDIYMKGDAPQTRVVQRQGGGPPATIPNLDYNIVTHAHRNDIRNATLGSTSKMQAQALIRHDRLALADHRPWNQAAYGQICGYYRKHPEHPLNPGKSSNANLIPGAHPGPNDMLWAVPGAYPMGHPLEGSIGGLYSNPEQLAGYKAKTASSLRYYAPYKSIPAPSQAAVKYIRQVLGDMSKRKAAVELIKQFETYYKAWKQTWFAGQGAMSSNSISRTQVPAFDALVRLGSSIVPHVVAKLCDPRDFMAVRLYNALEKDARYRVSAKDAPNYLVLQRHANLIVELNKGRVFKVL